MLPVLNHLPTNDALELCMDVDERKSASPLDSIPTEVLMSIICFLPTKDILKFALSSKKNYNVALPLLYCELNWRVGKDRLDGKHSSVLRNIEFLNGHPELYLVVKNLQITEKRHQLEDNTKLYPDPSFDEDPYNISSFGRVAGYEFKSTHELTNKVTRFLPRFEGLTELTLRSITLPRTFYQSIHTLSSMCLRRLIIRHCRLTTRYPKGYSPLDLRLTELTIFRIDATASRVLVAVRKLRALLKLAQCPTLRLLRLDRTVNRAVGALVAHGIPPSIHTLELDWGTHRYSDQNCGNLFLLLNRCKFIRHLELTDIGRIHYHSGDQRLSSKALPYLTSLKIPVIYVGLFLQSSPIDTLIITDSVSRDSMNLHLIPKCLKLAEISSMLDALQNSNVHLRSLKFNLRYWDKEVFYMLSEKQGMIKELSIGYQYGEIDDEFFMSIGPQIEFPFLEKLHLYRFGDYIKQSGDEERYMDHKEYLIIWQLYMSNIREVALTSNTIWRRSGNLPSQTLLKHTNKKGFSWSCYLVEPVMDGTESLIELSCPRRH